MASDLRWPRVGKGAKSIPFLVFRQTGENRSEKATFRAPAQPFDTQPSMEAPGYDPNFLGETHVVALPTIEGARERHRSIAHLHFSARFNTRRRLAYFSALNSRPPFYEEQSKAWDIDDRVGAHLQADNQYYRGGTANSWDRGHLAAVDFAH